MILEASFLFQAEDGIRDLVRSRGLGDVYKRQDAASCSIKSIGAALAKALAIVAQEEERNLTFHAACLLYTSDAADERSSVDLGGRRIIKKKHHAYRARLDGTNTNKHERRSRSP